MANRSPTPASKTNEFYELLDDIWGFRGRRSLPILGVPGGPGLYLGHSWAYWVRHMAGFVISVLVGEPRMLTIWPNKRPVELMFVDLCSLFPAGAVCNGPGPNFDRKSVLIEQNYNIYFVFQYTLCSAIKLPGRNSGFRAGCRPESGGRAESGPEGRL